MKKYSILIISFSLILSYMLIDTTRILVGLLSYFCIALYAVLGFVGVIGFRRLARYLERSVGMSRRGFVLCAFLPQVAACLLIAWWTFTMYNMGLDYFNNFKMEGAWDRLPVILHIPLYLLWCVAVAVGVLCDSKTAYAKPLDRERCRKKRIRMILAVIGVSSLTAILMLWLETKLFEIISLLCIPVMVVMAAFAGKPLGLLALHLEDYYAVSRFTFKMSAFLPPVILYVAGLIVTLNMAGWGTWLLIILEFFCFVCLIIMMAAIPSKPVSASAAGGNCYAVPLSVLAQREMSAPIQQSTEQPCEPTQQDVPPQSEERRQA